MDPTFLEKMLLARALFPAAELLVCFSARSRHLPVPFSRARVVRAWDRIPLTEWAPTALYRRHVLASVRGWVAAVPCVCAQRV